MPFFATIPFIEGTARGSRCLGSSIGPLTLLALFVALFAGSGCTASEPYAPLPMDWSRAEGFESGLPQSVRVFAGRNLERPVRAYRVDVDLSDPEIRIGTAASSEADGRQTPTTLASATAACVLINGGYYWLDRSDRGHHIGLLVSDSRIVESPLAGIIWERVRYPVARATIGALPGQIPEITWVSPMADSIVQWNAPFMNKLGRPAIPPDPGVARPWRAAWALSAGPVIVSDGRARSFLEEEGFFDTYIPQVHPRSAAGLTRDGRLVLVVVDGRQPHSRGVSLEELAVIMRDLGTERAINLDGGGSAALVVGGRLVNRPSGTEIEREIVSAITVNCSDHDS